MFRGCGYGGIACTYCGRKGDDDVVQGSCIRFVVSMGEVRVQYMLRCDQTDNMVWIGELTVVGWRKNAMRPKRCESLLPNYASGQPDLDISFLGRLI